MEVSLGSPPQTLDLLVDITYPYMKVDDAACPDCEALHRFHPSHSSSFRKIQDLQSSQWEGSIGQDSALFGSSEKLQVYTQTFYINKRYPGTSQVQTDGLLVSFTQGLGVERPFKGNPNFVESLQRNGQISSSVFALYLNEGSSYLWNPSENSSISFGFWNLSRYSTSNHFDFVSVDLSSGRWIVDLVDPRMESEVLSQHTRPALLSTAYSAIFVPERVYANVKNVICRKTRCSSLSGIRWNCTNYSVSHLGDLSFNLGAVFVTLPARSFTKQEGDWCEISLNSQQGADYWILGTPFLRKYYILFDIEKERIGLAPAKQDIQFEWTRIWWICGIVSAVLLCGACCCQSPDKKQKRR